MWAVVGVGHEAGVHFHLLRGDLLLFVVKRVPGGNRLVPRRQLGVRRDHAEFPLPLETLLAEFVPTLVELALERLDPLRGNVVWGVRRAGGPVDEEEFIRGRRLLTVHPRQGLFHEVRREVVIFVFFRRLDRCCAAE